jgi:SAM-dependent methyltransferase
VSRRAAAGALLVLLVAVHAAAPEEDAGLAPYVATPQAVVDAMLALAQVSADDIVYDLGSGDGRIIVTAAWRYGARGVGLDIDERLVELARTNARRLGVSHRAEFRQQDVMTADLSAATVVTLYLLSEANLKLRPKLLTELGPGTRIVSHRFGMGDWLPADSRVVETDGGTSHTIYLWRIDGKDAKP